MSTHQVVPFYNLFSFILLLNIGVLVKKAKKVHHDFWAWGNKVEIMLGTKFNWAEVRLR
jgi:hypothetical protein